MTNPIMQLAYRLKGTVYRWLGVKTRGVKVMVFTPAGELLLVRHSYGDDRNFLIPGGGIRPLERPAAAARREIREEVGMDLDELRFASGYQSSAEGKKDSIFLFTALSRSEPRSDSWEIAEARCFPLDALPDNVSRSTRKRIEEYRAGHFAGGAW